MKKYTLLAVFLFLGLVLNVFVGFGHMPSAEATLNIQDELDSMAISKFNSLYKPTFKIGMKKSADVKAIQQFLKDEEYYFGKVDGKYGKITARAVKDFAEDNDITLPTSNLKEVIMPKPACEHAAAPAGYHYVFKNGQGPTDGDCGTLVADDSTVYPKQDLTVLSPNGGETFAKGTTQTIKWRQDSGCPSGVICTVVFKTYEINLISYYPSCAGGTVCPKYDVASSRRTIANGVSGSSYDWTIPNCTADSPCSSNFEIPAGAYMLQVCQEGTSICDSSDSYFKIINSLLKQTTSDCVINSFFASPSTVMAGEPSTLSWTASNCANVVLSGFAGSSKTGQDSRTKDNTSGSIVVYPLPGNIFYISGFSPTGSSSSNKTVSVTVNKNTDLTSVPLACSLIAQLSNVKLTSSTLGVNTGWSFDVTVNAKNPPIKSNGWTANFQGYTPSVVSYGVPYHYGDFFVSSGSMQFTVFDTADSTCTTTITVNPPVASTVR